MNGHWTIRDYTTKAARNKNEGAVKQYYLNKYSRLARNVYTWDLPEELDETILEKYLWEDGRAVIWESAQLGLVVTRCVPTAWDFNGRARRVRPVFDMRDNSDPKGSRDFAAIELPELDYDECAIIYDTTDPNILRSFAMILVDDIADVRETIRQQVFNQKTPLLAVSGDTKMRNKLKNLIVDIGENAKAIFIDADLGAAIKALDFNAPFNITELHSYLKTIENEILEYIGIDNTDAPMKKERLLVDEVEGNDEIINYFLADGLKARYKGVDNLRKMGVWATVEIQGIVRPMMIEEDGIEDSGEYDDDTGIDELR